MATPDSRPDAPNPYGSWLGTAEEILVAEYHRLTIDWLGMYHRAHKLHHNGDLLDQYMAHITVQEVARVDAAIDYVDNLMSNISKTPGMEGYLSDIFNKPAEEMNDMLKNIPKEDDSDMFARISPLVRAIDDSWKKFNAEQGNSS